MDANPKPDIAVIAISLVICEYDWQRHHGNGSLAIAALATPVAQVG